LTPFLQPHLILVITLKALSPNTVTWGVKTSKYEWGRVIGQSIREIGDLQVSKLNGHKYTDWECRL
jgi:hypothetical protein